jgi:hypothetical protein
MLPLDNDMQRSRFLKVGQVRFGFRRRHRGLPAGCLFCPQERTSSGRPGTSEKCQTRKYSQRAQVFRSPTTDIVPLRVRASEFDPEKFEDHYEEALTELINAKRNGRTLPSTSTQWGKRCGPHGCAEEEQFQRSRPERQEARKACAGQKEMLGQSFLIPGSARTSRARAADQGHSHAMLILSGIYPVGRGTPKDNHSAYKWAYIRPQAEVISER